MPVRFVLFSKHRIRQQFATEIRIFYKENIEQSTQFDELSTADNLIKCINQQ
jgi:hypothetical protein